MHLPGSFILIAALASSLSQSATIDGDYPVGVTFIDRFVARDTQVSVNAPKAFAPSIDIQTGSIRIRHLPRHGKFLVSQANGTYEETVQRDGTTKRSSHTLNVRSQFDELGYSGMGATDPANLIPIFPGHPVHAGDEWRTVAPVTGSYGHGTAYYVYHVTAVRTDANHHVIAEFSVNVSAQLTTGKELAGWRSALQGSGTLQWDCTEHQRRSSSTKLEYHLVKGPASIFDVQTETDEMQRAS